MIPRDTTLAAAAVHVAVQRRLGPIERLRAALDLSDLTHSMAVAGVQRRHPAYTRKEAAEVFARTLYGSRR